MCLNLWVRGKEIKCPQYQSSSLKAWLLSHDQLLWWKRRSRSDQVWLFTPTVSFSFITLSLSSWKLCPIPLICGCRFAFVATLFSRFILIFDKFATEFPHEVQLRTKGPGPSWEPFNLLLFLISWKTNSCWVEGCWAVCYQHRHPSLHLLCM